MWLARAWLFLNCPDAVPALFKKRKRERNKPNLKKAEENFLPIIVFCKHCSFLLPSPSAPDEAGDENGSFVPFPGAQLQRKCGSGNSRAREPGREGPSCHRVRWVLHKHSLVTMPRAGWEQEGSLVLGTRLLGLPLCRSKQDAKHTWAEEGEVGASDHVVLVGTDHGLGSSGLLAFPKVGICSPVEAGSILLGACSGALAPALGCSLHPSSLVVLVL